MKHATFSFQVYETYSHKTDKKRQLYHSKVSKEGDPKDPFLIATTPRCRGRVLLLSLDCFTLPSIHTLILLNVKQGGYQVPF